MKLKYLLTFGGLLSMTGCNDMLDLYPLDKVTEAVFWTSKKDVELYCNKFYSCFPDHRKNLYGGGTFTDGDSDNQYSGSDYLKGTRTVPSSASGTSWSWGTIREINYFFENYSKVPDTFESIKHYVGEMYFFKAWHYFTLVRSYGDVPWYDKVLNMESEDLYAPRTPRSVVMDSICSNLDKAIAYLADKGKAPVDRFSKDLALAFKVRVCLYEGTWEKYHAGTPFGVQGEDGKKFLRQACEAAEELMSKGYDLYYDSNGNENPDLNYKNIFNQTDYSDNPEIIFWKKYDLELNYGHDLEYFHNTNVNPTLSLVNSYLCQKDGKPIYADGNQNVNFKGYKTHADIVDGRDPRIKSMFWVPGDPKVIDMATGIVEQEAAVILKGDMSSATGFDSRKGKTLDSKQWGSGACTVGAITMRYAEILLAYAEAKYELGELNQDILDKTINKLRDRVAMPHLQMNVGFTDPNWDFPALDPILNEIRRERRVELAFENLRNYDLCRWAAFDEVIVGKRPKGIWLNNEVYPDVIVGKDVFVDEDGFLDPLQKQIPEGFGFRVDQDYLNPIPTEEIVLNPNLKQNPGWEN